MSRKGIQRKELKKETPYSDEEKEVLLLADELFTAIFREKAKRAEVEPACCKLKELVDGGSENRGTYHGLLALFSHSLKFGLSARQGPLCLRILALETGPAWGKSFCLRRLAQNGTDASLRKVAVGTRGLPDGDLWRRGLEYETGLVRRVVNTGEPNQLTVKDLPPEEPPVTELGEASEEMSEAINVLFDTLFTRGKKSRGTEAARRVVAVLSQNIEQPGAHYCLGILCCNAMRYKKQLLLAQALSWLLQSSRVSTWDKAEILRHASRVASNRALGILWRNLASAPQAEFWRRGLEFEADLNGKMIPKDL